MEYPQWFCNKCTNTFEVVGDHTPEKCPNCKSEDIVNQHRIQAIADEVVLERLAELGNDIGEPTIEHVWPWVLGV